MDPNICVLEVHLNPLWFVTIMVTHWDAIFRPHAESGVGWPAIFTQLRLTTRNSVIRSENVKFDKSWKSHVLGFWPNQINPNREKPGPHGLIHNVTQIIRYSLFAVDIRSVIFSANLEFANEKSIFD